MKFEIEIIAVENGFVIIDGNSATHGDPYQNQMRRRRWVAKSISELAKTIEDLATAAYVECREKEKAKGDE